jgi:small conductance mechanosensitive channel
MDMEILGAYVSKSVIIIIVAFITWVLTQILSARFVKSFSTGTPTRKRLRTLNSLVRTAASAVILVVAAYLIVRELGFDVTPLLASAGIASLAIAFGAQSLIKDMIAGAFILIENYFDEGDEVEILGKKGEVKKISLRTVWLIDREGNTHIIPNGSINHVTNFSKK